MDPDRLTLIRPDRDANHDEVIDLTGKTFGRSYWDWVARARQSYYDQSHYDWSASTIGLLDGRIVTHWGVWGFRTRIGRATVRVAGIGAVSTHGDCRKRGLMARTATAGIEAMRQAGYDMTLLFGIRDFYHRFGYVRAWPGRKYFVPTADLPRERPAGRLRAIPACHRDDLAALYNRTNAGLTGTAVRPTYIRRSRQWQGRLWADASGRPLCYLFTDRGGRGIDVWDYAGPAEQVLRAVGSIARRAGQEEASFSDLHHDSEVARALRRGTCRVESYHHRSGGAMIRTLSLASALGKLTGELSRRLKRSPLARWRGGLLIADGREKVTLNIRSGNVRLAPAGAPAARHAVRGGDAVAQLLIGTDEPHETAAASGIRLTGDAKSLLPALFPTQHPTLASWDHF